METLELPIAEESDEGLPWPVRPVNFAEQEIDLAAFKLWREASRLDTATDQDAPDSEERA